MPVVENQNLKSAQCKVAREQPETRQICDGEAFVQMRVDPDVYENARLANLDACDGGNIWDSPEFCQDMMRRHPELKTPVRSKRFAVTQSRAVPGKTRNRHGTVSSRTRFRGQLKIEDRPLEGIRVITHLGSREQQIYDLDSGERL